jgi:hypothetical protein
VFHNRLTSEDSALLEHQEFQSEDDPPDTTDDKPNRYKHHAHDSAEGRGFFSDPPDPPESPRTTPPSPDHSGHWYKDRKFVLEVLGFLVLFAYTWFACLQWLQIRWSNRLTREALNDNSFTLQETLKKLQGQIEATDRLYVEAQKQTANSRTLATNSGTQAGATLTGANAAQSAAETAKATLHISQRAYIITGIPVPSVDMKSINVPIFNVGHLPSGHIDIVIHELTANTDGVHDTTDKDIVERHWDQTTYESIPPSPTGSIYGVEITFPEAAKESIIKGAQRILAVAIITYNDGFPNSDAQTWVFCEGSQFDIKTKEFAMRPCNDPQAILSKMRITDEYPSKKYETH